MYEVRIVSISVNRRETAKSGKGNDYFIVFVAGSTTVHVTIIHWTITFLGMHIVLQGKQWKRSELLKLVLWHSKLSLYPVMPVFHLGTSRCFSCSTSNPTLFPAYSLEKQLKSLGPCTQLQRPGGSSDSQLQIRTALAIVAIWGVSQQMKDPSLYLSFSLDSIFQIKSKHFLKRITSSCLCS